MKYRVEFPIKFDCNLRCYYCFHADYHNNRHPYTDGKRFERAFTLAQWEQWRNMFLSDADEILVTFAGGEPFVPVNAVLCKKFMGYDSYSNYQYEFLTNGLFEKEDVEFLYPHIPKIKRIGFTYHRRMIHDKPDLVKKFYENLTRIQAMDIPVYVKELLRVEDRGEILKHKKDLKNKYGIELKIQDYRGDDRGLDNKEAKRYSETDGALVDIEYKHEVGKPCACLSGYKDIKIRGYDEYSGNVIACWHDPVVVGNIQDMRFNPKYTVNVLRNGSKYITGVPRDFAGTNPRDLPIINNNKGESMNTQWVENRIDELKTELQRASDVILQHQSELTRLRETALRISGAITVLDEQVKEAAQAVAQAAPDIPEGLNTEAVGNVN